jgi:ribose transport system permease protein
MDVVENQGVPPVHNRGLRWITVGISGRFHAYALLVAWAIVIIVFSLLRPAEYPTRANFDSLISTQATLLLLAIAFMIPIIIGDLDLSVSGTAGLSLTLVGYLNGLHNWPIALAALAAIGAAILVGVVNVTLVIGLGVDVIVTTLGVYTVLVGVSLGISGAPIGNVSAGFTNLVSHSFLGLQVSFWIVIALCVVVWYVLSQTPLGRRIFVTGANREVARLSGLRVAGLRSLCLMTAAVLGGLAGVLIAGVEGSSDPTTGPSLLFPALAAVFLGSTARTVQRLGHGDCGLFPGLRGRRAGAGRVVRVDLAGVQRRGSGGGRDLGQGDRSAPETVRTWGTVRGGVTARGKGPGWRPPTRAAVKRS